MESPTTKQPYAVRQRDWHDGLFDCTNDCASCWLIFCCYPCYMCYMYRRYDECWATPCLILFPGLTLRAYHRAKHNIHVSQIIYQFLINIQNIFILKMYSIYCINVL
ncbi:Placenta-specificprotein 8 protein [Schistosoma japonicum]|nr:Placenta-specificprotein 8 protein [Schistosoma japonicum]